MSLLLKQIFQLIKLLNSETGTKQIALGIALGFILGMTPALSLQTILVFVLIFLFRVQAGAAFCSAFFFKFIAYLLDPVFDKVGAWALHLNALKGLYTTLYNMPIIPYTRFNNTIVMGSGIVAILLTPVIFVASIYLVKKYRQTIVERFRNSRFFKALKATALYKWYYKYEQIHG